MARRIYEEDSSCDGFEEALLQRTPRLRGGLEEVQDGDEPSAEDYLGHARNIFSTEEEDSPPGDAPVYSRNDSDIVQVVKFMSLLCDPEHVIAPGNVKHIDLSLKKNKCGACGKRRLQAKKFCSRCGLHVHLDCEANAPIPCIVPTPIRDIDNISLKECAYNVRHRAKVPAILKKLFHELQKVERIREPQMYMPPSTYDENDVEIKKWTGKLCRSPARDLTGVPTWVLTGCVLRVLMNVKKQIISNDEFPFIKARHRCLQEVAGRTMTEATMNSDLEGILQKHLSKYAHYRRHTLAAVMLHLRTLIAYNAMTEDEVLKIFRPVIPALDTLFIPDDDFWLSELESLVPRYEGIPGDVEDVGE